MKRKKEEMSEGEGRHEQIKEKETQTATHTHNVFILVILVVYEKLRGHEDETKDVDAICQRLDDPAVPRFVRVGDEGVKRKPNH